MLCLEPALMCTKRLTPDTLHATGKTTTVNMLTGILPPTGGEALVCDQSIMHERCGVWLVWVGAVVPRLEGGCGGTVPLQPKLMSLN